MIHFLSCLDCLLRILTDIKPIQTIQIVIVQSTLGLCYCNVYNFIKMLPVDKKLHNLCLTYILQINVCFLNLYINIIITAEVGQLGLPDAV